MNGWTVTTEFPDYVAIPGCDLFIGHEKAECPVECQWRWRGEEEWKPMTYDADCAWMQHKPASVAYCIPASEVPTHIIQVRYRPVLEPILGT